MALLVCWAGSGEWLAQLDTADLELHGGPTVRAAKACLSARGLGSRFRLRLLREETTEEMEEDETLLLPCSVKLVVLSLLPADVEEDHEFVQLCSEGRLEEVEGRLFRPQEPNSENKDGWNALQMAAWTGRAAVARILLEAKACCNHERRARGTTPLHAAAWNEHLEVLRVLLEARASSDPIMVDKGTTPLHLAAWNGQSEAARLLLEAKAACNQAMTDGATPLHLAAETGHEAVVRLLLEARASCTPCREAGRTPFHLAAQKGHLEVVRLLLETGAFNPTGTDAASVLGLVPEKGRGEVLRHLLEARASFADG
ncbi:Ankyrin-1 (ANK-1) (Ankyrin-R) (Erythrocyte ankyrin) [Durusdinium trenchii]|uniref:Ankyrin-1 (ANK-1) (Ankyrin-R) (Erythrocyte ankyrin) n=1 Tax=Durusdinium trenchii TaxID=1381693 RepID=A0ABP0HFR7_9DINO